MENFKEWFRYPFQDTIHTPKSEPSLQKYLQIMNWQSEEIEQLKEQLHKLSDQMTKLKYRIDALENDKVHHSQLTLGSAQISASSSKRFASLHNSKRKKGGNPS